MNKYLIGLFIVFVLSLSCNAQNTTTGNETLNQFLSELEALSLGDGQKLFTQKSEQLLKLLELFDCQLGIEPQNYTPEEEENNKVEPREASIDPKIFELENLRRKIRVKHMFYDWTDDHGEISNELNQETLLTSVLKISNDLDDFDNLFEYTYTIDSIHYKDGTSHKVNQTTEKLLRLDDLRLINSVTLSVNCPGNSGGLSAIKLSNQNKTAKYRGVTISLLSINQDLASFQIEGGHCDMLLASQAKTKLGYYVNTKSSYKSDVLGELKSQIIQYLSDINSKINSGSYKTKEDFIADVKEQGSKIGISDSPKNCLVGIAYKGNVEEVCLYFRNNDSVKIQLTVPVKEELNKYNLRPIDLENNRHAIVDQYTNIIARIPDGCSVQQLSSYFYFLYKEEDVFLYRLDSEKGLVESSFKQDYEYRKLTDDLFEIMPVDNYYQCGAIDSLGNAVIPMVYTYLEVSDTEDLIIGTIRGEDFGENKYVLYDLTGKEICQLSGNLSNFNDGLAMLVVNGKAGYINAKGEVIIPFMYDEFSSDFSDGVTRVRDEEGRDGLINTKNEIVLPFSEYQTMTTETSSSGRIYTFDDKKYDSKGRLIK